jgi:cysteine synthase
MDWSSEVRRMKYRVILKRTNQQGKVEEKRPLIEATSQHEAMEIALKIPENRGFYVWGVKQDESES